jgi:hypothetical protein
MHKFYRNDRALQLLLLAFMVVFYGGILLAGPLPHPSPPLNLTFNSMAANLLHGRFDVDPATVSYEGFLRNGHVYAYWGIYCALLRIPLILLHRPSVDITLWSLLAAVCLSGFMLVRTLLLLRRTLPETHAANLALGLLLLCVLFAGSQLGFLHVSIYQEVCSWAAAFGMVFVYFAIKGLLTRFDTGILCGLAVASGLAVLTRVATGIGLCVAVALLLVVLLAQAARESQLLPTIFSKRILLSCALLVVLLVAAGVVNYGRWGNPLTFADHRLYIGNQFYPDRAPRIRTYGYFSLRRLPLGLIYFFFPLWALHAPGGEFFFQAAQLRLLDATELPPSSFLLTDLLPLLFIASLYSALKHRTKLLSARVLQAAALASGLCLSGLLLLTAFSMNYRYRLDFYPAIYLLTCLGLYTTVSSPALSATLLRRRRWLIAALSVSIVSSCLALALYKLSEMGPALPLLNHGLCQYYRSQLL